MQNANNSINVREGLETVKSNEESNKLTTKNIDTSTPFQNSHQSKQLQDYSNNNLSNEETINHIGFQEKDKDSNKSNMQNEDSHSHKTENGHEGMIKPKMIKIERRQEEEENSNFDDLEVQKVNNNTNKNKSNGEKEKDQIYQKMERKDIKEERLNILPNNLIKKDEHFEEDLGFSSRNELREKFNNKNESQDSVAKEGNIIYESKENSQNGIDKNNNINLKEKTYLTDPNSNEENNIGNFVKENQNQIMDFIFSKMTTGLDGIYTDNTTLSNQEKRIDNLKSIDKQSNLKRFT